MKKMFLILLILLFLPFFFVFNHKNDLIIKDNFIMLSIEQNVDGSVKQSIVFDVNSNFIRKNSKNVQEELIFKKNLIKNVEEIRNEFLFSFALIFMNNPNDELKINKGVLLSQVGYNNEGDYIGFEITFTSSKAWQYYHNIPTNSKEVDDKNTNIFIEKQESKGIFPFSVSLKNDVKVGEKYKSYYLSAGKNLSFFNEIVDKYKPQYIYNYSTFYPKFHSNAQNQFKGKDGRYHHIWIEDDLLDSNQTILSVYLIHKGWWIFFTLVICLGTMLILILIVKIKDKKKMV